MTTDRPTAAGTATTVTSANLSYLVRRRIFLYLGILIVPLTFGAPGSGLIDIPITFLLKNKLHLKAHELADFRLVSASVRSQAIKEIETLNAYLGNWPSFS
jgi:hypothetical protein